MPSDTRLFHTCSSLLTLLYFRVTITDTGSLKILETLPNDSGLFRCVASNIAGERQSRAAALIVIRRPHFVVKPSNLTALVGQNVEFNCQVRSVLAVLCSIKCARQSILLNYFIKIRIRNYFIKF